MIGFRRSRLWLLAVVIMLPGCGGSKDAGETATKEPLPERLPEIGAVRSTEVRTFVGESLWEYIDGGAEQYHEYGFKEVKTAEYKLGDMDVVVDIYEFSDATNAYGLYTALRPEEPDIMDLGVECYVAPASVEFVKGNRVLRLVGFDESPEMRSLLVGIAKTVEQSIQGAVVRPSAYDLFPIPYRLAFTDKYFAKSYFGHQALTKFYAQDYGLGSQIVTLFFTLDDADKKLQNWSDAVEEKSEAPHDLPFDDGKSLLFDHSWYGKVIVGIKNGKLVGMTNYDDSRKKFLLDWLNELK